MYLTYFLMCLLTVGAEVSATTSKTPPPGQPLPPVPPPVCRENEIYKECGTACPLTCDNYKNPPAICTKQCVKGCFCQDGYVRDRNMRCVKPQYCAPPACKANEIYKECGTACPLTCDNYKNPPAFCTMQCVKGCFCQAGYVRDRNMRCVKPQYCAPRTCGLNEHYERDSHKCQLSCSDYHLEPVIGACAATSGCYCDGNLVRDVHGKCVKREECPPRTCSGVNEVFVRCPPPCPPTDNCYELWTKYDCSQYPKVCNPQCRCKSGYARNKKGVCITTQQCIKGE